MKFPKFLFIFAPIILFSMIFIFVLTVTGQACLEYDGFAIDSSNNIYIGKNSGIDIYDLTGTKLRTFELPTDRGYKFTIYEEDKLLVYTGSYYYIYELSGELLDKVPATKENRRTFPLISSRIDIAHDGSMYIMKDTLMRTGIYRIDENERILIYQMPLFDYSIKLLKTITHFCGLLLIIIIIVKFLKAYYE